MRQVLPKREGAILSSQTVPLCPLVWWQLFSLARINDLARGACGVRFPKSSVQKGSERHWLLPKTNNQKETKKKKNQEKRSLGKCVPAIESLWQLLRLLKYTYINIYIYIYTAIYFPYFAWLCVLRSFFAYFFVFLISFTLARSCHYLLLFGPLFGCALLSALCVLI